MKYMLLIYLDEHALDEAERQHCYAESTQLAHELKEKGQFLATAPLQPVATATTVRVREGKRLITDGPFAEMREQLGGFYMVEAEDLDAAIGIAGRIPGARVGAVEIRPVIEIPGLPGQQSQGQGFGPGAELPLVASMATETLNDRTAPPGPR